MSENKIYAPEITEITFQVNIPADCNLYEYYKNAEQIESCCLPRKTTTQYNACVLLRKFLFANGVQPYQILVTEWCGEDIIYSGDGEEYLSEVEDLLFGCRTNPENIYNLSGINQSIAEDM